MTARKKILAGLVVITVLGGVAWLIFRTREPDPIYEGKPLSYWVARNQPREGFRPALYKTDAQRAEAEAQRAGAQVQMAQADAAVRHAGTNAIPLLLRLMRAYDSASKRKLIAWAEKRGIIKPFVLTEAIPHHQAACGFEALGADGKSAVPELMRIYKAKRSWDSQDTVLQALGSISVGAEESIPLLVGATTNPEPVLRIDAVEALGKISNQPARIVPSLLKALNDPDRNVRESAVYSLGNFGRDARPAVPALLDVRKTLSPTSKFPPYLYQIDEALKKIDPAAAANAGIQTNKASPAQ
ncbi:MAG TPA: HEAT repeat domain-containing protein [Verrucomicrobiae bacterium]|jgi:hypothetical protein|nr:HEAT repeat domain-containing protein [Verrucomicrobiae bacterium]